MIYVVERADGRIKIGYITSLYKIGLGLYGGRLIALMPGHTNQVAKIKKQFSEIPAKDGWLLMTSSLFSFIQENSLENSSDPEQRRLWAQVMLDCDNERDDTEHREHDCVVKGRTYGESGRFHPRPNK